MAERWAWGCCDVPAERSTRARQLDAICWGAFFIWVGVALLADFGIGIGLLGVGVITVGGQVLRRLQTLPLEGFWVVVGTLFLLGGIWELFSVQIDLVPLLLIAAGVLLFLAALRPGHSKELHAGHRG